MYVKIYTAQIYFTPMTTILLYMYVYMYKTQKKRKNFVPASLVN